MDRPMSKTWPTPRSVIIGPTQRTAALNPFSHLSGESERFASFVPEKSVGKPGGNDDDHRARDHSRDALCHSLRRPSPHPAGGPCKSGSAARGDVESLSMLSCAPIAGISF